VLEVEHGENTFEVRAVDKAGNADPTPASHAWKIGPPPDTTPPDTEITDQPDATTVSTNATFAFSANEPDSTFECSLEGAAFEPCSSPKQYTDLTLGEHVFLVRATDLAGNTDPEAASYVWKVEEPPNTTAPETTIDSGPDATTTSTDATFAFSSDEPDSTFECSLDDAPFEVCTSPQEYTDLALGRHTFSVRATDVAGNVDPEAASYVWTVEAPADTTAPDTTITDNPADPSDSGSASFGFTGSDDRTAETALKFECRLDGGEWVPCSSPHSYAGLGVGPHAFEVRAIDEAGNVDSSPASHSWTIVPPDTTPPETTIDSGPAVKTTATRARFAFSADEAGSRFECSLDGAPFEACSSPKEYAGLAPGKHEFLVRAVDRAGNAEESPANYAWTIFSSDDCRMGTIVAPVEADAWMDEGISANKGSDAILSVRTDPSGGKSRALVRFALPREVPPSCVVESAKLRMFAASTGVGTRFQVVRLASGWAENVVTWSDQPETTGAAATAWSEEGFMQWNVTAQVQAMLDGGDHHGFVIRSAAEGTDAAAEADFHSREKGDSPPQLVIRFGAPPSDEPPGPPAPPSPAAVHCGQELTQSTLVTNDLSECPGDGLVIGADRIIIDLDGHTIDGTGLGTGVLNDGHESVTVKNGTVRDFDYGVRLLSETRHNVIERLTLELNQLAGIELFDAWDNEVLANTV
jgi:hypothetical protein